MGILDRISARKAGLARRDNETTALAVTDWAKMFRPGGQVVYQGRPYQAFQTSPSWSPGSGYYEANSVVFACESKRLMVFSEARFQWQQLRNGRPGDLFGTAGLSPLEEPWRGATTRDLLVQAELDVACHGNSYWVGDGAYLLRLDPRHVTVLTEAAIDAVSGKRVSERLLGYACAPDRDNITIYAPDEIAHYKPLPDAANRFVGVSWLSACLPDIDADHQFTEHKRTHLRNGANLAYAVSVDASVTQKQFEDVVRHYRENYEGAENSGKTLFLAGGADVKTVGSTFENLALKATQGATETRIAACAGVHPVVVGLSEGLQGSSLNAGNYGAAKRNFVDGTMRPLWGAFAAALQSVVRTPERARLWYDARDIPFLREDMRDIAEIEWRRAQTIRTLTDAGYTAESVVPAVVSEDLSTLVHSGLFSVQLQPAGMTEPVQEAP